MVVQSRLNEASGKTHDQPTPVVRPTFAAAARSRGRHHELNQFRFAEPPARRGSNHRHVPYPKITSGTVKSDHLAAVVHRQTSLYTQWILFCDVVFAVQLSPTKNQYGASNCSIGGRTRCPIYHHHEAEHRDHNHHNHYSHDPMIILEKTCLCGCAYEGASSSQSACGNFREIKATLSAPSPSLARQRSHAQIMRKAAATNPPRPQEST